jgi:transitional endoplasmic reticulum ATPase
MTAMQAEAMKKLEADFKIDPNRVVSIENRGDRIILPEGMTSTEGMYWLHRNQIENEKVVSISEEIDASPMDGAVALNNVIARRFGFTALKDTEIKTFMGKFTQPPQMLSVEVGPGRHAQVPWGDLEIPGINGIITTSFMKKDGRFIFRLAGKVQRNSEGAVHEIANLVRQEIKERSIYKGTAVRVRFRDDDGDLISNFNPLYAPAFIDVSKINPEEAIYNPETDQLIKVSLHDPVLHTDQFRSARIPLKQGVLMEGTFGTGKTLAAHNLAKIATENGWTFIYVKDIEDLALAFDFARQYQPAVLFTEDIDQVVKGQRDIDMNKLMEMLDGVDSKNSEIMVLFTTNAAESIHEGFIRPGRIDTVIPVRPPTLETSVRLARLYGRGLIEATDEQLHVALEPIKGRNAAFVREAVERSKRFAVGRSEGGEMKISGTDIRMACLTMERQLELTDANTKEDVNTRVRKATTVLTEVISEVASGVSTLNGVPEEALAETD